MLRVTQEEPTKHEIENTENVEIFFLLSNF